MKFYKIFLMVFLILCIENITIQAQTTYTWLGGNGNWNTGSKWIPDGVPGVNDTAIVNAGTVILNSNSEISSFLMHGGELKGNGTLAISYQMQWSGGLMSGAGTTEIVQGALLEINSSILKELNKRTLSNAGTIVWTDTGRIGLGNNAVFIIQDGGIFDIQTDATIADLDLTNNILTNNGLITKRTGAGPVEIDVIFNNQNRVNIETGTLNLNHSGTDDGVYDVYPGSLVDFHGTNRTLNSSATLMGVGILSFTGDSLTNNANINPGTSPGIIGVNGNLPLSDLATVNIEIGGYSTGSEYDRITVTDSALFNGNLNISFINGFVPLLSDTFKILTYTQHRGQFNLITGNNFGNGFMLGTLYTSDGLVLIGDYQPVALNDSTITDEDVEISINVLANDYDPANDSLSIFAYTQPLNGTVTQNADSLLSYLPSLNYNGWDSFTYIIKDEKGGLDTATVSINVISVNDSPTIISIPDTVAVQDLLYSYLVVADDPDSNDVLSYSLTIAPNFLNINSTSGLISGTPTNADIGIHSVNIRVMDSFNTDDTQSFILTVTDVNYPPVISPLPSIVFAEDDTLVQAISGWYDFVADPDDPDNALSYTLAGGLNVVASLVNLEYSFYAAENWFGIDTLQLIVSDGFLSDTSDLYFSVTSVNDTPNIISLPDTVAVQDLLYTYQVMANNPDPGDVLSYLFITAPNFLSIDTVSGLISGTPTNVDIGVHFIALRVADSFNAEDIQNFVLTVTDVNFPPVISSLPILIFAEDDTLIHPISDWFSFVTDPDDPDDALSYTVESGSTVIVSSSTLVYSFYAPENWFGQDTLRLIVSDGFLSDTSDLYLSIKSINDIPNVSLPDSVIFRTDSSASLSLWDYVSDIETPDSLLITQFLVSNDSVVYNYNSTSGVITLSAQAGFSGDVYFTVTVFDDSAAFDLDTIIVSVTDILNSLDDILSAQIPKKYSLSQNYPNPFNPSTKIKYDLPNSGRVSIAVFNLLGQKIITLLNESMLAGSHELEFNARNLPSGVYLYRIEAGEFQQVRKMVLLK